MKAFLFTLALVGVASFADAQGTIQIANNAGTRFRIGGVIPPVPPAAGTYNFGVFVGLTADSLSCDPVLPLARNSGTAGLITADNLQAYPIPGQAPDSTVFIQIRGWEARFGTDWLAGARGGLFVQTPVKSFVLGPAAGPGTVIWSSSDLTKFQALDSFSSPPLDPNLCIPEPSTFVQAGLAFAGLLLLRHRKRAFARFQEQALPSADRQPTVPVVEHGTAANLANVDAR